MTSRLSPSEYIRTTDSTPRLHSEEDEELPLYSPRSNDSSLKPPSINDASPSSPSSPPLSPLTPTSTTSPSSSFSRPIAPPTYTSHDAHDNTFALHHALIYGTSSSHTARYHLSQRLTKSGRPYQLRIRRLVPSEARRVSLPEPAWRRNSLQPPKLYYDEEQTMYIITNENAAGGIIGGAVQIKGCRASCVPGAVHMESGKSVRRGRWWRFVHVMRNVEGDYLKEENEAKLKKYGYKPKDEWRREPMLEVRRRREKEYEWVNVKERVVAVEEDGRFMISVDEHGEVDRAFRDLVVTCWLTKRWLEGEVNISNSAVNRQL